MIEIEVNNKTIQAQEGEKLIAVCDRENIIIPRFCYHKDLSIAANCRMCLVDITGNSKPQPACSTSVYAGMKCSTHNEHVKKSQQAVMEFLLINHPLDCPICDQGGECELQDVAINYGNNSTTFSEEKRVADDFNTGPLITTEMTRCIHCTRCVRFGSEIAGLTELGATGRGEHMSITSFLGTTIDSELSGNMIDICPVGALTSKPFRYSIRSWQMKNSTSIARHDLIGSNLNIQSFDNKVYRISAKENSSVNASWISDRDRFSYTSLNNENRALYPKIKKNNTWCEVSWQEALEFTTQGLQKCSGENALATLADSTATLEELYLLKKLTNELKSSDHEYRLGFNTKGYSYLDSTTTLTEVEHYKKIIIIGTNPRYDEPMLNYRIRKASINGAYISAYIANDSEFNYPIKKYVIHNDSFVDTISELSLDEKSLVILGSEINTSKNINKINQILAKTSTNIMNISTSGNTISARKVGFVADNIFDKSTYILFNIGTQDITQRLQESINASNFVISMNSFDSANELADVVLPLAGLYETSGTHINIDNFPQSFAASVSAPAEAKPGWKIIKALADMLNLEGFDFLDSTEVKDKALALQTITDTIVTDTIVTDTIAIKDNQAGMVLNKTCYQIDAFTRSSQPLQQTKLGESYVG